MRVNISIDCTPEEARHFFGLPDVKPLQDALMRQMQDQLSANLKAMDPEQMMRTWLPVGIQGFEQMQKLWAQMGAQMSQPQKRAGADRAGPATRAPRAEGAP